VQRSTGVIGNSVLIDGLLRNEGDLLFQRLATLNMLIFAKIRELLEKHRHWKIAPLIYKLNSLLIGWLNFFSISKVTHIWETIKVIITQLDYKLFKWLKSKGQKVHKLLRQQPFITFVKGKGLLDLVKYARLRTLTNYEVIMNTD
jgi:glutaredoxin-related protein